MGEIFLGEIFWTPTLPEKGGGVRRVRGVRRRKMRRARGRGRAGGRDQSREEDKNDEEVKEELLHFGKLVAGQGQGQRQGQGLKVILKSRP